MRSELNQPLATAARRTRGADSAIGAPPSGNFVFALVTIYVFLDLVRPPFVWHIPKMISVILVIALISKASKVWCPQLTSYMLFLGIMTFDILLAKNTYDAIWTTYGMFTLLIGVCLPLINFTDSLKKLRQLIYAILAVFLYMAVYAITHEGFGPAGGDGGQDENYVAASMNLVIPLALFLFFAERAKWKKVFFATVALLCVTAIVVGLSRGGFVGLLGGLGFWFLKTPRKGVAILAAVLLIGFMGLVAGPYTGKR